MPNIAAILKEEIRRLAKREVKISVGAVKTAVVRTRRDVARLKRDFQDLQRQIGFMKSQLRGRPGKAASEESGGLEGVRHSARSVRAQRKRLKLSAADFGKLLGVSLLTVYNWEHGKARPTKARLSQLVAIRKMGRREALAKLESLGGKQPAGE